MVVASNIKSFDLRIGCTIFILPNIYSLNSHKKSAYRKTASTKKNDKLNYSIRVLSSSKARTAFIIPITLG
jgi:hypothetical protein